MIQLPVWKQHILGTVSSWEAERCSYITIQLDSYIRDGLTGGEFPHQSSRWADTPWRVLFSHYAILILRRPARLRRPTTWLRGSGCLVGGVVTGGDGCVFESKFTLSWTVKEPL